LFGKRGVSQDKLSNTLESVKLHLSLKKEIITGTDYGRKFFSVLGGLVGYQASPRYVLLH
jgi:hypothetical protein